MGEHRATAAETGEDLGTPPVGVRVLEPGEPLPDLTAYQGISYCDAVRQAGQGQVLLVQPGSLQVCHWSPVVLGLKQPQGRFEKSLTPRLPFPTSGLILAPLDRFPGRPQVVLVRTTPAQIQALIEAAPPEHVGFGRKGELATTALPIIAPPDRPLRQRFVSGTNRVLAFLARSEHWRALTHWLFRSKLVTIAFEALISRVLVDMSMCRNSTVIPLLTGQVNASFFCTGGITWGLNRAECLTSGWPVEVWDALPVSVRAGTFPSGPVCGEEQ